MTTELWYLDHADRDGKTHSGPFLTPDEAVARLRAHGPDGLVIAMGVHTDEEAARALEVPS